MAENLGLGFGETASVEMLPEEGSCTPKARARLATRSHACWALTCCLVSFPILAGLTTYLLIGQLRAQGDTCVFQVSNLCPDPGLRGPAVGTWWSLQLWTEPLDPSCSLLPHAKKAALGEGGEV